jgi:hypothetical protein
MGSVICQQAGKRFLGWAIAMGERLEAMECKFSNRVVLPQSHELPRILNTPRNSAAAGEFAGF